MTVDRIFYGYMALVGLLSGAVLVTIPATQDFFLKPYFWVLIAVALFEVGTSLFRGTAAATVLTMKSRLIGFAIGIALMVAVPIATGAPVHYI